MLTNCGGRGIELVGKLVRRCRLNPLEGLDDAPLGVREIGHTSTLAHLVSVPFVKS
jgi:hypothetical protein